jgi:hypothetical protein
MAIKTKEHNNYTYHLLPYQSEYWYLYSEIITPKYNPDWIEPDDELLLYNRYKAKLLEEKKGELRLSYKEGKIFHLLKVIMIDLKINDLDNLIMKHKRHYKLYPKPKPEDKLNIDINDIKKRILITDLLGKPDKTSINRTYYKAPWRDEKQPSLVVYTNQNTWYDFGECVGGDVINLYMKLNNCNFKEAINGMS